MRAGPQEIGVVSTMSDRRTPLQGLLAVQNGQAMDHLGQAAIDILWVAPEELASIAIGSRLEDKANSSNHPLRGGEAGTLIESLTSSGINPATQCWKAVRRGGVTQSPIDR